MGKVEPDKPVISVDASMLEKLPDDVREALELVYDEREREKAKAFNDEQRAYQAEQAETLLAADGGWVEVVLEPTWEQIEVEQTYDHAYPNANLVPEEWIKAASGELKLQYMKHNEAEIGFYESALDAQVPTIHQFYEDLYGISGVIPFMYEEGEEPKILVNHRDREHPYQLYDDYWEFIEGVKPETSFIYMGAFWQPPNGFLTARRNAMITINGFCVDIDRFEDDKGMYFQASWVMNTLLKAFEETPELEPNYLMLSGTGIQLWYVFGEQIPLLSKESPRRQKYGDLLKRLYGWFDEKLPKNRFKVDVPCATISHAFRAPGSPSKHHYPTRLFVRNGRRRKMVNPLDLSLFLGGDLKPYDLEDWNQEEYERIKEDSASRRDSPATVKQLRYLGKLLSWQCIEEVPDGLSIDEADALIKKAEIVATKRVQFKQTKGGYIETSTGNRVKRVKRPPGLYFNTLERMHSETPAGSRYNAMFGLAGLGWNCGIPKSKVESDLMGLLGTEWAERLGHDGKPLEKSDVKAAMKGWHPLGALRKREQLEARLQWKYNPPAKRNGRKRPVHLGVIARPMIEKYRELGEKEHLPGRPKGSGTKKDAIQKYVAEHPEANHSEIARALGVSRPTVIKWLKAAED